MHLEVQLIKPGFIPEENNKKETKTISSLQILLLFFFHLLNLFTYEQVFSQAHIKSKEEEKQKILKCG